MLSNKGILFIFRYRTKDSFKQKLYLMLWNGLKKYIKVDFCVRYVTKYLLNTVYPIFV